MTGKRFGEVILPSAKGVTVAGTLDEASAVEYAMKGDVAGHEFHGNRYTGGIGITPEDHAEKYGAAHWANGKAKFDAPFHEFDIPERGIKAGQPMHIRMSHWVGRGPEAEVRAHELVAAFPKAAGVRYTTLGNVPNPGKPGASYAESILHGFNGGVTFTPDKTTGAINEAGARRYRQMATTLDKLGIPVEMTTNYGPIAFKTREEFEAALAKHIGK